MTMASKGAYYTGVYRNLFQELGYEENAIREKLERTWAELINGNPDVKIYYPMGDDMGYFLDTGNTDVRTEGMSYGMMMAVQMNDKEIFDPFELNHL
jgi:oligosaccharide reducing-end xylanase